MAADTQLMLEGSKGLLLPGSPTSVCDQKSMECEEMNPWALMEEAMAEEPGLKPVEPEAKCIVTYLPDGDIHVCKGPHCPFLQLNEDKCYVCSLSGIMYGVLSVREDYSTGRQAGSSNPDDHAGEPVGGSWKPKKDMQSMSNQAYIGAETLKDDEESLPATPTINKRDPNKPPVKRGARCVDEPQQKEEAPVKRQRSQKRSSMTRDKFRALVEDAENILCRLVNFDKRVEAKPSKPTARDPRLMDKDVLFNAAMKKYAKECMATGTIPTLDAIHNISIAAANIAAEEKRKASLEEGNQALILKVRMREQITSLAVSLWSASCETPYMEGSRRGADSFRPFISGVLYALKRGVSLPDGTPVVPACPKLAEALPALRATAANSVAKALHASSHRGLCTLHRSISSCSSPEQANDIYEQCARLAHTLARDVKAGRFDLF